MSDKPNDKPNDGSISEDVIRFRVSTDDKEKIREYFGSYSAIRDYVLKEIESKGDVNRNEDKTSK